MTNQKITNQTREMLEKYTDFSSAKINMIRDYFVKNSTKPKKFPKYILSYFQVIDGKCFDDVSCDDWNDNYWLFVDMRLSDMGL